MLRVTLLERSQKGPKLTEAGEVLLHHVRAMSDAAMMVSMAAISQSVDVSRTVRITAFDMMAAQLLPAILLPLREKAPGVRPQLISSNSIDDLLRREADIAVRHVRPSQPELIARHVGDLATHLYAAPAYLDRVGRPSSPRDAGDLTFVAPIEQEGVRSVLNSLGIPISDGNFTISSDAGTAISGCVKAGSASRFFRRRYARPNLAMKRYSRIYACQRCLSGLSRTANCRQVSVSGLSSTRLPMALARS